MHTTPPLSPELWAEQTFGAVALGDKRRTQRAVRVAARMARNPSASFPEQLPALADLKAAYRLLDEEDVTCDALLAPHQQQTRQAAQEHPLLLLVQDTTELNYTHHPTTTGLGEIGKGTGRGYLLQSVLAIVPSSRQVVGLLHQEPFLRQPAPKGETTAQRLKRPRESQVWSRAVQAIGAPPPGNQWVHVGDRYSDLFPFLAAAREQECHFLVRAYENRRVRQEDGTIDHLLTVAATLSARDERVLDLPASHGHPARRARVKLGIAALTLLPPRHDRHYPPLAAWLIRVWEVDAPPEVAEPLEWLLLTSVPTTTAEQAWERVAWYSCRWVVEDYHSCLKTGCAIEQRHLHTRERLWRLLGFCAPLAIHLLQLRDLARREPDRLAAEALPGELVRVLAALADVPLETLTVGIFWQEVARFGGYLGRRRDGPPGWKTLWRGWRYLQTVLEGVHLADRLPP